MVVQCVALQGFPIFHHRTHPASRSKPSLTLTCPDARVDSRGLGRGEQTDFLRVEKNTFHTEINIRVKIFFYDDLVIVNNAV